jgi:micrococcal nuclease
MAPRGQTRPACRGPRVTTAVVRVIDGDTLVLHGMGRVRLIGLDAPETWLRHDCFGTEATQALRRLTPPGSPVDTAGDVEPRDRYGRRLLYLWTSAGVFVNATLVRKGFARAMTMPPNTSHAAVIYAAEETARRTRAGVWRADLAGCGLAHRLGRGLCLKYAARDLLRGP